MNEKWLIKEIIKHLVSRYVPFNCIKTAKRHPWYNETLKRLANKKERLFRYPKQSNMAEAWHNCRDCTQECTNQSEVLRTIYFRQDLPSLMCISSKWFWHSLLPSSHCHALGLIDNSESIITEGCVTVMNEFIAPTFVTEDLHLLPTTATAVHDQRGAIIVSSTGILKCIEDSKLSPSSGRDDITSKIPKHY